MRTKYLNFNYGFCLISTLLTFWFVVARIEPFLHYYLQHTGINVGFDFFKSHITYPGGISDYLGLFFSQFFKFNKIGSFIIIAFSSFQGLIAINLIHRIWGKFKWNNIVFALHLILGVLVLCNYLYPFYITIRLLFTYVFIWIFYLILIKKPKIRFYVWLVLAILLFYFSSGAALFIFSISSGLMLIKTTNSKISIIGIPLMILFAIAIPYLGYKFLFAVNLPNLYRIAENRLPEMLLYTASYQLFLYYLLFPSILFVILLLKQFSKPKHLSKENSTGKTSKTRLHKTLLFSQIIQVIIIGAFAYLLFLNSYDSEKKKLIYIDYLADEGKWQDLIKVSNTIDKYDAGVNYQVNRAYAESGELPDKLFQFPQMLGSYSLFYDKFTIDESHILPTSDLYFDLGYMSESLHWAYEAQTLIPYSPRILKRLIMINLVNKEYNVAENFLNVLDKNILYRKWVARYRTYIQDTSLADKDPVIAEKRRFSPKKNTFIFDTNENLKLLLETNMDNRLAYDYMLAKLILDVDMENFVRYLSAYKYYNYKTIPKSWAEALTYSIILTNQTPPYATPDIISQECKEEFVAFDKMFTQYNNNKAAAQLSLSNHFKNTYMYYLLYLNPTNKSAVK